MLSQIFLDILVHNYDMYDKYTMYMYVIFFLITYLSYKYPWLINGVVLLYIYWTKICFNHWIPFVSITCTYMYNLGKMSEAFCKKKIVINLLQFFSASILHVLNRHYHFSCIYMKYHVHYYFIAKKLYHWWPFIHVQKQLQMYNVAFYAGSDLLIGEGHNPTYI